MDWSQESSFPPEPSSVAQAREFVLRQLIDRGRVDIAEEVRLVTSELATNAVIHAKTKFTVRIREDANTVTVMVTDGSDVPPRRAASRRADAGGLGLNVVERLASDCGFEPGANGGKSVWATFERPAAGQPVTLPVNVVPGQPGAGSRPGT